MKLPEYFEIYFKELMNPDEFELFKDSFDGKRVQGIRLNTLKINGALFEKLSGRKLPGIPWIPEGFRIDENESPGKHPYYHAGLYYIQEPSAMMPAQVLAPRPGQRVLDLCAAPGGKTTQIGCLMRNKGIIVTNDISPKRVKALVKNVELMGITNALILNETPERLSRTFPDYFDKILLDMPCSGEGMFRKDKEAVRSYSRYKSSECVGMQRGIFDQAYAMLKPGGTIVYSTCTFNPDENERNMEFFMSRYDLVADRIEPYPCWESSRGEWALAEKESCSAGLRFWPHLAEGEGHFVFRLKKPGKGENTADDGAPMDKEHDEMAYTSIEAEKAARAFKLFENEAMNSGIRGVFHVRESSLFRLPPGLSEVPNVRWEKAGLYLGEYRNERFEPSGSLVTALRMEDFKIAIDYNAQDQSVLRYLKGETLIREGEKGYAVVCVDGFPLGWAKQENGMLKNLYPKGWRMQ